MLLGLQHSEAHPWENADVQEGNQSRTVPSAGYYSRANCHSATLRLQLKARLTNDAECSLVTHGPQHDLQANSYSPDGSLLMCQDETHRFASSI